MVNKFKMADMPRIDYGSGIVKMIPSLLEPYGSSVLLITGRQSFTASVHWDQLLLQFESARLSWKHHVVEHEPKPQLIDDCVAAFRHSAIDVVVAIGGGSVIDAGKAISAMLRMNGFVKDYLEGVGTKKVTGEKVPFIAVPTTAGTGSEATKNAVISEVGINGFKKSLRHDHLVPNHAVVDPQLTLNCPQNVTAQSGMDAFTQLLESYLSTNANPMTDALAMDGIRMVGKALPAAVENGDELGAREQMAYASLLSGITLANAGLGTIHGFASAVGSFFDIPHGLICARLMGPVNKLTVRKLKQRSVKSVALRKYTEVGKLFCAASKQNDEACRMALLDTIDLWTERFGLRRLADFGVKEDDFDRIIDGAGNKFNPVPLDRDEMHEALAMAL
jgi:alcohol dehydrogenase class IV